MRSCTCHPGEAPVPCQHHYAFSECRRQALIEQAVRAVWSVNALKGIYSHIWASSSESVSPMNTLIHRGFAASVPLIRAEFRRLAGEQK